MYCVDNSKTDGSLETSLEWNEVPNYKGLLWVHKSGKIKSSRKILKTLPNRYGYLCIRIGIDRKKKTLKIHRLIASTFLGECPSNRVVHHKDANKQNNSIYNLEYITQAENIGHAVSLGTHSCVRKNDMANHTSIFNDDLKKMFELRLNGFTRKAISKVFGISHSHTCKLLKGKGRKDFPLKELI